MCDVIDANIFSKNAVFAPCNALTKLASKAESIAHVMGQDKSKDRFSKVTCSLVQEWMLEFQETANDAVKNIIEKEGS
ncbi:hypothetical protein CMI37_27945 [Candidatus Pacearchaeota archaeon]|nr:hypothetical protein [Candidatus Pacearchaeota archaeon]